jgi:hypothetical protein
VNAPLPWEYDDGGRHAAGYRGGTRDCVCRAIAIATEIPYATVYAALNQIAKRERPGIGANRSSARNGVMPPTSRAYLASLGWAWTPTMRVGSGCTTHLAVGELPAGRLIARVSHHFVAVIDGVMHDTFNPARDGRRCVYGYWTRRETQPKGPPT